MKFQKYYNVLKINDATKHAQNGLKKCYTINKKRLKFKMFLLNLN